MKRFLFIIFAFILSMHIALAANSVTDTLHEGEIETYDLEGTPYMVAAKSVNEATPHTANFIVNGQSTTDLETSSHSNSLMTAASKSDHSASTRQIRTMTRSHSNSGSTGLR